MLVFIFWPIAGILFVALPYMLYEMFYLTPRGLDKVSKCRKIIDKEIEALRAIK